MGIFSKLIKTESKPLQNKEYTYQLSSGFKGTKRFNITTHGNTDAIKGLNDIAKQDIKHASVVFREIENGLAIHVNGINIGALYPHDQNEKAAADRIRSGALETVYIKIEQENVGGEVRNKAFLFLK